jgi:hypothetical protein
VKRFSLKSKFILFAAVVWLCLSVGVLVGGLNASHVPSSAGGVAMQMAVLSFPSSAAVGELLNSIQPWVKPPGGAGGIVYAWAPFFIAGCLQLLGIVALVGGIRKQR